jgi:plasmid stabilization system protein ParE
VTFRVRVRSIALAEFAEATEWYSARSVEAAARFVLALEATLGLLANSADSFHPSFSDIRRVRVPGFPYAVYFRLTGVECQVLALMHVKRHPRRWQRR